MEKLNIILFVIAIALLLFALIITYLYIKERSKYKKQKGRAEYFKKMFLEVFLLRGIALEHLIKNGKRINEFVSNRPQPPC